MLLCKKLNLLKFTQPLLISSIGGLENSCTRGLAVLITKGNRNQTCGIRYLKPNNSGKTLVCNYSKDACESPITDSAVKASDETDGEESQSLEKMFEEISQGNPEVMKKLKILEFEVAIHREHSDRSPELQKKHWEFLLKLPNISQKKKFLDFLFKNQKKKENSHNKKKRQVESRLEKVKKIEEESGMEYKIGKNALFLRINDKSLLQLHMDKLMGAKMFSQNVVFDCSYDSYMTHIGARICGKQLGMSFYANRMHSHPFEVKLCNVNPSSVTMKFLGQVQKSLSGDRHLWEMHEESYLDLYPKKKLVYLTPHCRSELHYFDHSAIYIIGAFVDKGMGAKVSIAKAKKYDLKMAKLPIDRYIQWDKGTKNLPLNLVLQILLDRQLHDWQTAFQNLPRRNVRASYFDLDELHFRNGENVKTPEEDDEAQKKSTEIL